MKKTTRHLLFFFFAAAFFVSAPLVVLYTAGFRISLNNQRIQQTGAIAVSTTPRGATIRVDNRASFGKTPTVVQNISPSDVTVHIEKKGYIPWEQVVHVNAGSTTYVSSLLFTDLQEESLQNLAAQGSFIQSPNGRYLAMLGESESEKEIAIYDVVARYKRILTSFVTTEGEYSLQWLPDTSLVVLSKDGVPQSGFTPSGDKIEGASLTTLVNTAPPVSFVDNGEDVEVKTGTSASGKLVALLPKGTYTVLEHDEDYLLVRDSRETLYLISLTTADVISLDVAGSLYDWLPEEDLLAWSDGIEVNLYKAETKERTFLTRQGELITALHIHPSSQAIIIGTENHITAIDAEEYKNRVHTLLTSSTERIHTFWLDSTGKNLYFVKNTEGVPTLYKRRLIK